MNSFQIMDPPLQYRDVSRLSGEGSMEGNASSGESDGSRQQRRSSLHRPRVSRKRQRPSMMITLPFRPSMANLNSASTAGSPRSQGSSRFSNKKQSIFEDHPDWAHLAQLLGVLLLTTALAVVSALDAEQSCLKHEAYAIQDLVDDETFQAWHAVAVLDRHDAACVSIFLDVVLPMSGGTFVLCSFALFLLYRQAGPDSQASLRQTSYMLFTMLLLLVLVMGMQIYNVASIMLIPRNLDDAEQEQNPYQSLAAVDGYGHVGDNANLYYLTWISVGLAMALVYQLATASVRSWRRWRRQQKEFLTAPPDSMYRDSGRSGGLLPATSWELMEDAVVQSSRAAWYNSLYKLRVRTGIWTAALVSCLVLVASSQFVYRQVVWPIAVEYNDDDVNGEHHDGLRSYLSVCHVLAHQDHSNLPRQLCGRTAAAWLSGVVAAALCATSIGMHLVARYSGTSRTGAVGSPMSEEEPRIFWTWTSRSVMLERVIWNHRRLPLRTELALSIILSILLGFNAVFCTGVQGPAATVGNLYYSSWLAFLLCVRICIGCLEECYNLSDDPTGSDHRELVATSKPAVEVEQQVSGYTDPLPSYAAPVLGEAKLDKESSHPAEVQMRGSPSVSPDRKSVSTDSKSSASSDALESDRVGNVRSYFFLGIFSMICAASAYDAASNQKKKLSREQTYMILAPCVVSAQSLLLFILCLSKRCYAWVSHCGCGGLLSIVAFSLWLVDLILMMHSNGSWAVNGIGEIEMANLYYFTWASILTAGLQMTSYAKGFLGIKMKDLTAVAWLAIVKVCFVILGAALHIWNTISNNCGFDEITLGAVTFCSRTVLAMIVALTGMLVGGLVLLCRMILLALPICRCSRVQAHVEMLVSLFLFLLFGAAVAMITGIGGPGQSVGDLYYSTWLAFWVSLGVFVSCYNQLNTKENEIEHEVITQPVSEERVKVQDSVLV